MSIIFSTTISELSSEYIYIFNSHSSCRMPFVLEPKIGTHANTFPVQRFCIFVYKTMIQFAKHEICTEGILPITTLTIQLNNSNTPMLLRWLSIARWAEPINKYRNCTQHWHTFHSYARHSMVNIIMIAVRNTLIIINLLEYTLEAFDGCVYVFKMWETVAICSLFRTILPQYSLQIFRDSNVNTKTHTHLLSHWITGVHKLARSKWTGKRIFRSNKFATSIVGWQRSFNHLVCV